MTPTIAQAKPRDSRVAWQLYINKIAVRELNSGIVQIKTGDGDWRDAEA